MNGYDFEERQHPLRPRFSGAVKGLIIINGLVFFIQLIAPRIDNFLGLVPIYIWRRYFVWQIFTYMFLHGGFLHLFFNMFVLWMFGSELESVWGRKEFLKFYFIAGIGAGIVYVIARYNSSIPTIGASGAIYGLLLAFALTFPSRYVYLFFIIPIKAKYLVLVFGIIEFFAAFSGSQDNIAHFAHLGGILVGFLYLRFFKGKRNIVKRFIFLERKEKDIDAEVDDTEFEDRVNEVLRKLSQVGFNGLTNYEKSILEEARRRYKEQ